MIFILEVDIINFYTKYPDLLHIAFVPVVIYELSYCIFVLEHYLHNRTVSCLSVGEKSKCIKMFEDYY